MTIKTDISENDFNQFTSQSVIQTLKWIKMLQKRMKESDVFFLEYAYLHNKMADEFEDFFKLHPETFVKVLRGQDLTTIAAALYYKDKIYKGEMTESELSDKLATKFLPPELKKIADEKMKELKR